MVIIKTNTNIMKSYFYRMILVDEANNKINPELRREVREQLKLGGVKYTLANTQNKKALEPLALKVNQWLKAHQPDVLCTIKEYEYL